MSIENGWKYSYMSLVKEHLMSLLVQSKHACDGVNIERILLDIKFGWYHDYKIIRPLRFCARDFLYSRLLWLKIISSLTTKIVTIKYNHNYNSSHMCSNHIWDFFSHFLHNYELFLYAFHERFFPFWKYILKKERNDENEYLQNFNVWWD